MDESRVYLDTYIIQQDMRIRMPKAILSNLGVKRGKTEFDIYLDSKDNSLILKPHNEESRDYE